MIKQCLQFNAPNTCYTRLESFLKQLLCWPTFVHALNALVLAGIISTTTFC